MEQRFLPGMSPGLERVAELARSEPERRMLSLAHHLDQEALERAFHRIRENAAVGVDGVSKAQYGENLRENLQDLHQRMKAMNYRHQPIKRAYVPKENGKQRPIGISTVEDKIVQDALRELLEVLYEPIFLESSYGFRPGRRAHDALRAINTAVNRGEVNWILEADIVSFFDRIERPALQELLQKRIADKSLMRLIGKCLHVGVLEGGIESTPEQGTVQGSTLSPMLGNIYLHYVLDQWFEQEVGPRMEGKTILVRYCDDFIIGFESKADADRVMEVLGKRLRRFGLELHPEKTHLLDFHRPKRQDKGKGPGTFDFLGFTHFWKRSLRGNWYMATKTRTSRLQKAKRAVGEWCRKHRHQPLKTQHASLVKRLQGHYNYFGVRGNSKSLHTLWEYVKRTWFKWLNRRSQRSTLTWGRFRQVLEMYPLPKPRIKIALWATT